MSSALCKFTHSLTQNILCHHLELNKVRCNERLKCFSIKVVKGYLQSIPLFGTPLAFIFKEVTAQSRKTGRYLSTNFFEGDFANLSLHGRFSLSNCPRLAHGFGVACGRLFQVVEEAHGLRTDFVFLDFHCCCVEALMMRQRYNQKCNRHNRCNKYF